MNTDLDRANARIKGIEAYTTGLNFAQCPFEGFSEDKIDLRWHWQKGWLRAQLEEDDRKKKNKT